MIGLLLAGLITCSPMVPVDTCAAITAGAARHGIDPRIAVTLAYVESRFDNRAVNPWSGATCMYQIMPMAGRPSPDELRDESVCIETGMRILAAYADRFEGDTMATLAAYAVGPNRFARLGWSSRGAMQMRTRITDAHLLIWGEGLPELVTRLPIQGRTLWPYP